jgi:Tol biopolymer transport system component
MIRAKWLSIIVCACLLLSPQSVISANPVPAQTEPPHEFDRLRQMITEGPAQFYVPASEPDPALDPADQSSAIIPPAWSKVAFQTYRNNQWDIYLVNPDGSNEVRLTDSAARDVYPSLAKGGSRLAFASDRKGSYDIFVRDINSGEEKFIYNSPATDTYPVWSPDAARIAFQSNLSGNYEIYLMNPDGSNLVQLTNSGEYDGEPSWSPDGSQITFVSGRSGRYEIWVMNADGSNPHQLTSYSTTATPAWSPRGDKIAYANDRNMDGYYELWWMDADGSNSVTAKNYYGYNNGDDWAPSWSPDGSFISFIHTDWSTYGWTASYVNYYEIYATQYPGLFQPFQDKRVMRISWPSTDLTPPDLCTISLDPDQKSDSFLLNWSAVDSESGVAFYDVQSRRLPNGAWQDFTQHTNQSSGAFSGVSGDQFEFRCRAQDLSWNLGDWGAAPFATTEIRSQRPTSTVVVSQRYVKGSQTIDVRWAGKGISGLALSYDVFVREGTNGDWTLWQAGVSTTSAKFSGTAGHTYYFRSQAHDSENRTQVWQPDAQAVVTFYPASLSVRTTDLRGNPLGIPTVSVYPAALVDETGKNFREKRLGVNVPLNISVTQIGFDPIPVTFLMINQDRSITFVMPPSDNLVSNGGFESGALNGWTLSGDGARLSNSEFHSGEASAKITPGTGGSSEFSQVVSISGALQKPTLSFLYRFPENPGGGTLTVEVDGTALQTVLSTSAVTSDWTHVWADLSA